MSDVYSSTVKPLGEAPDPFEEVDKCLNEAARTLRPFAEGRVTHEDYARVRDEGLPTVRYTYQIYPPPVATEELAMPQPILGEHPGAQLIPGPMTYARGVPVFLDQRAQRERFQRMALLYGCLGMLPETLNQDRQQMSQLLVYAFEQEVPKPQADAIVRQAAGRVAQHGPRALHAPDWPSTAELVLRRLERLLAQGVPITRDAFPDGLLKAREILDQIMLFEQADFRWFWCPREHWYAADRRGQKACRMHQRAERQGRWRRRKAQLGPSDGRNV